MTTPVVCASCGTGLRPNAKFCDECGTRLGATADAAQYKQVTVLFADVVRSMDIAAAVDLERLREIMTDLLERAAAVVDRYGGTVEHTGDGVMALFGAPIALEDHAVRACLAAWDIQAQAGRLAAEVAHTDGLELRVRTGLNSGRVIAGEIGSGSLGYGAIGEAVGMAQRMESVAPPGGVMLSESTAILVENHVRLGQREYVRIKGADEPVPARRLLAVDAPDHVTQRVEAALVGRHREMAVLEARIGEAMSGHGGVVTVSGPPGIGKSRIAREVATSAATRGAPVCWVFCESHARDISFGVVARLLRAGLGVSDADDEAARHRLRVRLPDADPRDLLLLDDLLGIAGPGDAAATVNPDARRRRLTELLHSVSLARTTPVLYVIEDAQWIDAASESMLTELLSVISRTSTMLLITARPEYGGALRELPGSQSIVLAPLANAETATLLDELLGTDPSLAELVTVITERAAGNPFFAEEMVRELAQRGVLSGGHGAYVCRTDVGELTVPATVEATIESRIDSLPTPAKRTLNAASVIGVHFAADLLGALGVDATFDELVGEELIDQVGFAASGEYSFRHPLIQAVAYQSQLKADRAEWHRRVASAVQKSAPDALEENASLIAEHLEAAGELDAAYGWHMRAAAWSTNRDVGAARVSWERARRIADALGADDPDRLAMRIGPRTMLCATDSQGQAVQESRGRFAELRQLCVAADDKVSLAIGMTGLATELLFSGRAPDASRLVSEQMTLLESIGDPNLTVGLAFVGFLSWVDVAEFGELLRWSQTVVDLAEGDPAKGAGFGLGSPLAVGLAFRGVAGWWLGRPGWCQDLDDAVAMARDSDPATFGMVVTWSYGGELIYGVRRADDAAMRIVEESVRLAEDSSSDVGVLFARWALSAALLNRDSAEERGRGLEMTEQNLVVLRDRIPSLMPVFELIIARERARGGNHDVAIAAIRRAVEELDSAGRLEYSVLGTSFLVEALVGRGGDADLAEARDAIDWMANLPTSRGSAMRGVMLVRLRALLAAASGDIAAHRDFAMRYHSMAKRHGYEGHLAWAEQMVARMPC